MSPIQIEPMGECSVCGEALSFDRSQTQAYCAPCWASRYLSSELASSSNWLQPSTILQCQRWLSEAKAADGREAAAKKEASLREADVEEEFDENDSTWVRTATEQNWEIVEPGKRYEAHIKTESKLSSARSSFCRLRKALF